MAKYTEDAKALLEYVGGTDNIQAVTHCVTRMRFVLFDETSNIQKWLIYAVFYSSKVLKSGQLVTN